MLALSPPLLFSPTEWPLDEFCSPQPQQVEVQRFTPSPAISSDPTMLKKLNHNASERHRRKKINSLYSSLRSMLPVADQMKKLSIPATISRVLKYIPELRRQVEGLIKKKEELLLRISRQGDTVSKESGRKIAHHNPVCVVSTTRLSDSEAAIQISSDKVHKTPLSEILLCLEKDGLLLLNASSSETFDGRVFYDLHLQVEKTCRLDCDIISDRLLSIYEKKEGIFQCL